MPRAIKRNKSPNLKPASPNVQDDDSLDDLPDIFSGTESVCKIRRCRYEEKQLQLVLPPAATVLAERKKQRPCTTFNILSREELDNIPATKTAFPEDSFGKYSSTIKNFPQGRNIFSKSRCGTVFNEDTLQLSDFIPPEDLNSDEYIKSLTKHEFHNHILNGSLTLADTAGPLWSGLSLYMLYLASVTQNKQLASLCTVAVKACHNWNPSVAELQLVFINWGMPRDTHSLSICEQAVSDSNCSINEFNIDQVFKILMFHLKQVAEHNTAEVMSLIQTLVFAQLDPLFKKHLHKSKCCINLILSALPSDYWGLDQVRQMCQLLVTPGEHFHNLSFMSTLLSAQRELFIAMSYCTLSFICGETDVNVPSEISLPLLLTMVHNLPGLPNYQLFIFITALNRCVLAHTQPLKIEDYKSMEQLLKWLSAKDATFRFDISSKDVMMLKNLLLSTKTLWSKSFEELKDDQ